MKRYTVLLATTIAAASQRASAFTSLQIRPSIPSQTLLLSTTTTTTRSSTTPNNNVAEPSIVLERVFATDGRPVILFDGVCNMCNGAVNLALDWDPSAKLRFSALQSNVGRALLQANGREADDISSIVLVTSDGAYIKFDAILRITEELTPSWLPVPLAKPAAIAGRTLVPKFLRDLIYDGVADNRYSILGMRDECRFGDENEFAARFVDDSIAMAAPTE